MSEPKASEPRGRASRRLAAVLLVLVAGVAIDVVGSRTRRLYDLTAQHSVSLTRETKSVVRQVHHKVKVTVS